MKSIPLKQTIHRLSGKVTWYILFWAMAGQAQTFYKVDTTIGVLVPATGLAITAGVYLLDDKLITPRCPCPVTEVGSFDRSVIGKSSATADILSDALLVTAVLSPIVLDFAVESYSPEFVQDMLVLMQVVAINSALVTVVKHAVQRPLPLTYVGTDPTLVNTPAGYRAFYSGHTSTAFSVLAATAYTLSERYKQGIWPYIAGFGLGTAIGLARVEGGRHFYTDILVGAVVGSAIGIVVPWLYRNQNTSERVLLAPHPHGIALSIPTNF